MVYFRTVGLHSPYGRETPKFPNFYRRIEKRIKLGLINILIIDGQTQTGKSTLGRKICSSYDSTYTKIFTVKDFLDYFFKCKEDLGINESGQITKPENISKVWNKWILFDEIEVEANRMEFWSEKNVVLMYIVSSFGWLHNHIVMTLPNIKGLSEIILTNLTMRITVKADEGKTGEIRRMAYIKKPIWSDMKNKYIWVTIEHHSIPLIEKDQSYEDGKANNFFNVQLVSWKAKIDKKLGLGIRPAIDDPYGLERV
jgi:hypothetical protein